MKYTAFILSFFVFLFLFIPLSRSEGSALSLTENMGVGIPLGGTKDDRGLDLCPMGVSVVNTFLAAWEKGDFRGMYDLIDESSKENYPFAQARFDLMMFEFKPYTISSVRKEGENFEFLLTYGDWMDGDKDMKKMIISGKTFKIIMPTKTSPFKKSAEDYL